MRKHVLVALLILLPAIHLAAPSSATAQSLKLDIKVFFGVGETTYVALLETGRERSFFGSYQVGFGGRLRINKAFFEVLFSFNRWLYEGVNPTFGGKETRVNSFELPFIGGYIPYKNHLFKVFLYAGYVNHFNTRIIVVREGDSSLRLRPRADNLAIYQAIARFGANFDIAMFNFDLNYSISLNSATATSYRTSYHQLQFNLGVVF